MLPGIRVLLTLTMLLLAACGRTPEPGVLVDGRRIPVMDMHLHTGTWTITPPGFRERLTDRVPTGFKWTMGLFVDYKLRGKTIVGQLEQ